MNRRAFIRSLIVAPLLAVVPAAWALKAKPTTIIGASRYGKSWPPLTATEASYMMTGNGCGSGIPEHYFADVEAAILKQRAKAAMKAWDMY